jgi:hypothetical protein
MRSSVAVFTVLLALIGGGAVVCAAPKTLRVVLSSPLVEEGSGPDGCTPAVSGFGGPAVWEVRVERFLLDGKALVETSREAKVDRFPLCIASLPVAKNAEVELSFVTHDGASMTRAAGIVLRFADPKDFYVVEADAITGHVRLVRVINGERREITSRSAVLATGKAQSLKVKATDEDFAVALDGKALFEAHDGALNLPGRFGIWSRADSRTSFGDLFITVLE